MEIPARLQQLAPAPGGRAWLDELPDRVERCTRRWSLRIGAPYAEGNASLVLPVQQADGSEVVLKLQYPHPECEHEAEALRLWDGRGAVRLLDHAPELDALLLERCRPGTHLSNEPPEVALAALIDLLPQLWRPAADPFHSLSDEAAQWMRNLPRSWESGGRPFEARLIDAALEQLESLAKSQTESVLLHQDLHADNVLRAERATWLAIDPKPLVGERAFGLAPIVRSPELGHGRELVWARLDRLSRELGVDRERARGWTFAQTLSWGFDEAGHVIGRHLEIARWLDEAR